MLRKTIDRYICLSVSDCRRMGFLKRNASVSGSIKWRQGAEVLASISMTTNTEGIPHAVLRYSYKGTPVETPITLRFKLSNLNNGTGYYYFVCPETGLSCRKLYLVNGKFVSRSAFRPLYSKQTVSPSQRTGLVAYLRLTAEIEGMEAQRYRRFTYRGEPTPFGRRYDRLTEKLERLDLEIMRTAETRGWASL